MLPYGKLDNPRQYFDQDPILGSAHHRLSRGLGLSISLHLLRKSQRLFRGKMALPTLQGWSRILGS